MSDYIVFGLLCMFTILIFWVIIEERAKEPPITYRKWNPTAAYRKFKMPSFTETIGIIVFTLIRILIEP